MWTMTPQLFYHPNSFFLPPTTSQSPPLPGTSTALVSHTANPPQNEAVREMAWVLPEPLQGGVVLWNGEGQGYWPSLSSPEP